MEISPKGKIIEISKKDKKEFVIFTLLDQNEYQFP